MPDNLDLPWSEDTHWALLVALESVAKAEGWDIFNDGPSMRIERYDELAMLDSDTAAWDLVINRAIAGSRLHLAALFEVFRKHPEERNYILSHASAHQKIALAKQGLNIGP